MTPEDILAAQTAAESSGRGVHAHLAALTRLDDETITKKLSELLRHPVLDVAGLYALQPAFDLIPYADAADRRCGAFRPAAGGLLLVCGDPLAPGLLDWADLRLGQAFSVALAQPGDLAACLKHHAERGRAIDAVLPQSVETNGGSAIDDLTLASVHADESPIVRLANSTLFDAYRSGASDIHLESTATGLRIKYRLDGVLCPVGEVAGVPVAEQVVSRLKVMAELDIAERRVPQDGRFKVSIEGREVDLRVSVMPSIWGEDVVLRILDKHALTEEMQGLSLASLGFDEELLQRIRRLSREPYGMLLVTGPTGSGKTTTLYAAISEINTGRDKIITIEDPVEYQLPDVLQIPVNEKKGLTFARGLRSILRHDPDKIMVGEIRDAETAQIAVQSALTGHLVLTTVHANNAFDVIGRFMHMGVAPHSFVSALNGVVAQRLLRLTCPHCSSDMQPTGEELLDAGLRPEDCHDYRFRSGRGCGKCRGTGYKGRRAIAELLHLDDELRELIVAGAPVSRLRELALANGMRPLREVALEMVKRGETTLEEINRVTFVA
jgi:general secretion pathway protein E